MTLEVMTGVLQALSVIMLSIARCVLLNYMLIVQRFSKPKVQLSMCLEVLKNFRESTKSPINECFVHMSCPNV